MRSQNICFVTGGAGFIGSHLCEALLRSGRRVIALDNFDPFYDPILKERNIDAVESLLHTEGMDKSSFELVRGDIRDQPLLETLFAKLQRHSGNVTIIHLAAKAGVRPSIADAPLYSDVNIIGTQNIFEAAKKYGFQKIIYASSSSVYGENTKVPFSETDPVDAPISPYAMTKRSCELLAYTYHHLYDMDMIGLRFFTVYGPRQRPDLAINKFTRMIDRGEAIPFYGDGSTRRDYTYIDDIIDGVMRAVAFIEKESHIYEIINLGESQTTTLRELVAYIEEALEKKAIIDPLPLQPGDVPQTYADISKAKAMIGYAPTTLVKEGIAQFVSWYKKQDARL